MPVTGLPVAVEAVLESLMSQYHLVSWQVSGGDRGVVLTLRWSTTAGELHQSPQRPQPGGGGSGGGGGHPRTHRKSATLARRSRRTHQWLEDQEPDTTDSKAQENGEGYKDYVRHAHHSIPRHRHHRHHHQHHQQQQHHHHRHHRHHDTTNPPEHCNNDPTVGDSDNDSDPPPLPPPPPILDNDYPRGDIAAQSDDSQATTSTVVEAETEKPQFKHMVQKHKKGILKMGAASSFDKQDGKDDIKIDSLEREGKKSKKLYPVTDLNTLKKDGENTESMGHEGDEKTNRQDKEKQKRRYHFRELIRKHSEEIKKIAAEQRRKERERQRLRELEKAKAKSRLRAHSRSEDNIVTLSSREEDSPTEENLRAHSEANVSSKNEDGARRVRFSETGAIVTNIDEDKKDGDDPNNPAGDYVYAGEELGDDDDEEQQEEDFVDPDDEVDSSDAEEIGAHPPRKIGALFHIGLMVAKRKRRTKLK